MLLLLLLLLLPLSLSAWLLGAFADAAGPTRLRTSVGRAQEASGRIRGGAAAGLRA